MDQDVTTAGGLSRRDMLRRSAMVGGALVWTAPAVQALATPAFAVAGSAGPDEACDEIYQFKIEQGSATFTSGQAPDCAPTGYNPNGANFVDSTGQIPNGHGFVTVTITGQTATITIPADCKLLDGQAKAGSANSATNNLECEDATPVAGVPGVYTVTLPTKNISFVAGVICC